MMKRRWFITLLASAVAWPFAARAQGKPKIATIGAGREGGALGTVFAKAGYPVMFSSRNPDSLKDLVAAAGPTAKAGTVADAVAFGDVVLLVVPYTAIEQIGKDYGTEVEVVSGLAESDNVIVNPPDSLATGTVVRMANAKSQ